MHSSMLTVSSPCFILGTKKSAAISFSQIYFMLKSLFFPIPVIFLVLPYHDQLHSWVDIPTFQQAVSCAAAIWALPLNAFW